MRLSARGPRRLEQVRYGRNGVITVSLARETDGAMVALFTGRSRSLGRRVEADQTLAG